MDELHEFEDELRTRLRDATGHLVAGERLHRQLISAAETGRRAGAAAAARLFRGAWALPAAAAVGTVLVAGSVVVGIRAAGHPTSIAGSPVGTPTFQPPASVPMTSSSPVSSTPPPTRPRTTARSSPSPSATPSSPRRSHHATQPSSSTAATSSPPVSIPPPPLPETCSAPGGGTVEPPTQDAFVAKIVGSWLACSEPAVFSTDDAGVYIGSDGTWAKLQWNSAGQLVRSTDPSGHGTWQVIDVSAMNGTTMFQLNFNRADGFQVITLPTFAAKVNRMHVDNNGYYDTDYVATSTPIAG
jgi:hypothetical protein